MSKGLPPVILINGKGSFSAGGGYQTYTYILSKLLTELGYSVSTFSFGEKTAVKRTTTGEIFTISSKFYNIPFLRSTESAGLALLAPILASAITKQVDFSKPVILWGIGPWTLTGAIVRLLKPHAKIFLLSYYPTTFKHEFYGTVQAMRAQDYGFLASMKARLTFYTVVWSYSFLERYSVMKSDKIINHYESADEILLKQFGVSRSKLVQIPYYVELVKRTTSKDERKEKLEFSKPLIVLVCRHDGRKGINFLLQAFGILNQRKVPFSAVLIGGGKLLAFHRKMADSLSLSNVHLPGFVADPEYYLKKADLYVFPSVEEGSSSIAILEAMKQGIPVVSTNVDGIGEDIVDGVSGVLVPPFDPGALARAIERCLKNPKSTKQIGIAGKKRFESRSNKAMVKRELQSFLRSLKFSHNAQ